MIDENGVIAAFLISAEVDRFPFFEFAALRRQNADTGL